MLISLCSYSFWRRSNFFLSSWRVTVIDPGGINIFWFTVLPLCGLSCLHFFFGREHSTIVEGQSLGIVHIMEGTFFRDVYLHIQMRTQKHVHVHIHIQIHIQIHAHIHVRVRVCLCFFLLCGAVSCRVPRVVGWFGVVWCEWPEGRWTNSLKSVLSCFVWWVYCNGQ